MKDNKRPLEIVDGLIGQKEQELIMAELIRRQAITDSALEGIPAGALKEAEKMVDMARNQLRHLRDIKKDIQNGKMEI